jgi:hypothetical protein
MNKYTEKGEAEAGESGNGRLVEGELDAKLEKASRPKKMVLFELPKDVRDGD